MPTLSDQDQKILGQLREPINHLVKVYGGNKNETDQTRLRQLAWQAVDVLVKTGNVSGIKEDENIKRILDDINKLGVSGEFVKASLALAISIYRKLEVEHPGLLIRYRGS